MKKALVGISLSLFITLLASTDPGAGDTSVVAPTMKVGDLWEFKLRSEVRTRVEIVEILPNGWHVQSRDRSPGVRFVRDQSLTATRIEGDYKGDPGAVVGWAFLEFPLHVGKRYSFNVVGAGGIPFTVDMNVKREEEVRTEAGPLPSFRLESCWRDTRAGRQDCGMTHWYAPGAKAIIKRESPAGWPKELRESDFEVVRVSVTE